MPLVIAGKIVVGLLAGRLIRVERIPLAGTIQNKKRWQDVQIFTNYFLVYNAKSLMNTKSKALIVSSVLTYFLASIF